MAPRIKSANSLDNNLYHKTAKVIKQRKATEADLITPTRNLECPSYLTEEAQKEWARIKAIDDTRAKPILFDCDISMLVVTCEFWSQYFNALKGFTKTGGNVVVTKVLKSGDTKIIKNPLLEVMNGVQRPMMNCYSALGLTPQGRAAFGYVASKKTGTDNGDYDDMLDE